MMPTVSPRLTPSPASPVARARTRSAYCRQVMLTEPSAVPNAMWCGCAPAVCWNAAVSVAGPAPTGAGAGAVVGAVIGEVMAGILPPSATRGNTWCWLRRWPGRRRRSARAEPADRAGQRRKRTVVVGARAADEQDLVEPGEAEDAGDQGADAGDHEGAPAPEQILMGPGDAGECGGVEERDPGQVQAQESAPSPDVALKHCPQR